jgi:DNA-binding NtrC family response regulator
MLTFDPPHVEVTVELDEPDLDEPDLYAQPDAPMAKVLIVDDQGAVRTALEVLFELHGMTTVAAESPERALAIVAEDDIGVVIQDMNFGRDQTSGSEGVELFRAIHKLEPDLPVMLMTAWTALETAVQLVKEGAADYFAKPWDDEKLVVAVQNLLRIHELSRDNLRLRSQQARGRRELAARANLDALVYDSAAMHALVSLAVQVAPSDAAILITGPNGSGKERLAHIVQANSRRKSGPFIKVNAGALPDELLEAELFGAEAGAYTGAGKLRVGRFEAADGGTLFLDEIGNLSQSGQMKLLRVLQTGEFERLGSSRTQKVDVRLVSATNADLPRAIREGRFREDLYYRLNVIELVVPPLRQRPEDILPLARHILSQHATKPGAAFNPAAEQALLNHDWPGNVRELENRVRRAVLLAVDRISATDLGLATGLAGAGATRTSTASSATPVASEPVAEPVSLPPASAEVDGERQQIEDALSRAQGVVSRAAAELGMSRQALYRRMERLGLTLERRIKP